MKKKFTTILVFLLTVAISFCLFACGGGNGGNNNGGNDNGGGTNNPPVDYGTLTIAGVTLTEGDTATINPVFTKETYPITYTFEGNAITITDGVITANEVGSVTVTATTEHHSTTFIVTVNAIDYGTLSVANVTNLEVGKTATINATFSKADKAEAITYAFDGDAISITDGVITALKGGETVTVTATTAHHTATFTVTTKAIDYGKLSIANVAQVKEGERAKLFVSFSNNAYKTDVTYTFDSDAISIENGYVTALKGGETVTVTATTEYHSTTFTVTTIVNVGELYIDDVYAWVDYPANAFFPVFTKEECATDLAYEYDASAIEIDPETNTVTAYKAGNYKVTATAENFRATFTVKAEVVDKNAKKPNGNKKYDTDFAGRATSRATDWNRNGKDGVTTAFIGDSFFDDGFWTNFYNGDYYGSKEAIRLGISATTSYDWEQWATGWLADTNPRNIVMHMGTNNIYDDGDDTATAVSALQRMFVLMHSKLGSTKIYWFSISQRSYDPAKQATVTAVNAQMKTWCDNQDWITYIHTVDTLKPNMLKDNIHPNPEAYYVFRDALNNTDIVISDKPKDLGLNMENVGTGSTASFDKATGKLTSTSPAANKRASSYIKNDGEFYSGNFVVSGTITTSDTSGWIALFVNSNPSDTWFNASEELPAAAIVFPAGNANLWGYKAGGANGTIASGVTYANFTFSVVSYNGKVLWQVGNGIKEITLTAGTKPYFGITNEANTINATIVADFADANVADAYDRIKNGQEVPDYGAKIDDITTTMDQSIAAGSSVNNIYYKSGMLNRNFILEGKLDITDCGTNAHIQFGIDGGTNRVLLWDNDSNKSFYLCIPYTTSGIPADDTYTKVAGQTLTISWKVVMTDSDLFFYIGNELKLVYKGLPGGEFVIGTEAAACKFYDMKATTKADDGANYETEIAKYASDINAHKNATGKFRV